MKDLIELSENVGGNLSKVTVPALIFSSTVDHVIPPEDSRKIYKSIASEEK